MSDTPTPAGRDERDEKIREAAVGVAAWLDNPEAYKIEVHTKDEDGNISEIRWVFDMRTYSQVCNSTDDLRAALSDGGGNGKT